MRAVVQRVQRAAVVVDGHTVGSIGSGLLVLLGVGRHDSNSDVSYIADKIRHLRLFADSRGKMDRSVTEIGGSVLVVSQFTLFGDCRRGRRPFYGEAALPDEARPRYDAVVEYLRRSGIDVQTGEFQAMMDVEAVNDGPVTVLLDSSLDF